jgi:polyhydroxybutyrate depolymerase
MFASLPPGDHDCTVRVGPRLRKYLLHVPKTDHPPARWPVVLCFHGGGSNPRQMVDFTGLSEAADRHAFAVVYPAGTGMIEAALTWNAGNCCGRALKEKVDEIAFVTALLDDLEQRLPVDPRRIYATGMSNGAMMCYLVANQLSERIAAIAPVAGPMGTETCEPARPVPIIHFHGTADEFAPFAGGIGRKSISKTNFYSVEHTIAQWVKANRCDPAPVIEEFRRGSTHFTRCTYRPADESGAEVMLYKIHNLGHTWPGRESRFKALGATTKDIDATKIMWEFFSRQSSPHAPREDK